MEVTAGKIKALINNFPKTDDQKTLDTYLNRFIDKLVLDLGDEAANYFEKVLKFQIATIDEHTIAKEGLAFYNTLIAIYQYLLEDFGDKKIDRYQHSVSRLLTYSLDCFLHVLSAYLNSNRIGVINSMRIIAENFAVMIYLKENKKEAINYLEYSSARELLILEELGTISNENNKNLIKKIKTKYQENIFKDFIWMKLPERDQIDLLVYKSNIELIRKCYDISKKYIHPFSFSVLPNNLFFEDEAIDNFIHSSMTLLHLMLNEFMDSNGLAAYKCNLLDNLLVGVMSAMTNNPPLM
jgi:hypothetical protein